jgi:hypothetical protein
MLSQKGVNLLPVLAGVEGKEIPATDNPNGSRAT